MKPKRRFLREDFSTRSSLIIITYSKLKFDNNHPLCPAPPATAPFHQVHPQSAGITFCCTQHYGYKSCKLRGLLIS